MIEIGINSKILTQILDGKKTIEGRLAKDKFLIIQPGDIISLREDIYENNSIVESHNDIGRVKVIKVKRFDNFRAMLLDAGFNKVIPNAKNLDEACDEYKRYYSSEDEYNHGVLAIAFHIVSS